MSHSYVPCGGKPQMR